MVTLTITLATTAVAVASMSAIQATPNNGGGPCHTDADCHLAGKCAVHVCDCSPEWLGNHCELLALLPAKLDSGFRPPAASSWGGKVVKGGRDDEFHLYAAMFTNHCGLQSWTHNSEVVHAVSSSPTGPYSTVPSERPILATFAHNPTVATIASTAHDDGLYVLAHIGCGEQTTTPLSTCFNGTSCTSPTNCSGVPNSNKAAGSGCDTPHWTGLLTSAALAGPWRSATKPNQTLLIANPNPSRPSWHSTSKGKGNYAQGSKFTNPSLWPFANGSVLLAYSAGCTNCTTSAGKKHIGVAYGATWAGPYVDLTPDAPIFPFASEDPCIFVSPETGSFHMFAHTDASGEAEKPVVWPHVSAHAFAASPSGPWTVAASPPYTRAIEWETGEVATVRTRERPQVIFLDGRPSLLVNGVSPDVNSTPASPSGFTGDYSYTHIQAIGKKEP